MGGWNEWKFKKLQILCNSALMVPPCQGGLVISRFVIQHFLSIYQLGASKTNFQSNLIRPCRSKTLRWKPPLNGKFNPRSSAPPSDSGSHLQYRYHNHIDRFTIAAISLSQSHSHSQSHSVSGSQLQYHINEVHNITDSQFPLCFRFTIAITISLTPMLTI